MMKFQVAVLLCVAAGVRAGAGAGAPWESNPVDSASQAQAYQGVGTANPCNDDGSSIIAYAMFDGTEGKVYGEGEDAYVKVQLFSAPLEVNVASPRDVTIEYKVTCLPSSDRFPGRPTCDYTDFVDGIMHGTVTIEAGQQVGYIKISLAEDEEDEIYGTDLYSTFAYRVSNWFYLQYYAQGSTVLDIFREMYEVSLIRVIEGANEDGAIDGYPNICLGRGHPYFRDSVTGFIGEVEPDGTRNPTVRPTATPTASPTTANPTVRVCKGICGTDAVAFGCNCDVHCALFEDCCPDYNDECHDRLTCADRCGDDDPLMQDPENPPVCFCDSKCAMHGDCCYDYEEKCSQCTKDQCGGKSSGACYCDFECSNFGDCCDNAADICGGTCAYGCYAYDEDLDCQCDVHCAEHGDCCSDYHNTCGSCRDSCEEYSNQRPCQCDDFCGENFDCCDDYKQECTNEAA